MLVCKIDITYTYVYVIKIEVPKCTINQFSTLGAAEATFSALQKQQDVELKPIDISSLMQRRKDRVSNV